MGSDIGCTRLDFNSISILRQYNFKFHFSPHAGLFQFNRFLGLLGVGNFLCPIIFAISLGILGFENFCSLLDGTKNMSKSTQLLCLFATIVRSM